MPGLSVSEMINSYRGIVGEEDPILLPDANCLLDLNRSWWQLQNILELPTTEGQDTFVTVDGTKEYPIDFPIEAVLGLSLLDPVTGKQNPLSLISFQSYDEESYPLDSVKRGVPEKYTTYGHVIGLLPIPDDVYTIYRRTRLLISDITPSSAPNIGGDVVLQDVIVFGAAYRRFMDTRDFDSARKIKVEWADLLKIYNPPQDKEDKETKFAQVKVHRANPYTG